MKTIKNLTVTVTYQVSLGNVDVPNHIYEELEAAYDNNDEINPSGINNLDACDWLTSNIKEKDCIYWSSQLDNLE